MIQYYQIILLIAGSNNKYKIRPLIKNENNIFNDIDYVLLDYII